LELPAETLHRITKYLGLADAANLARTCKQLRNSLTGARCKFATVPRTASYAWKAGAVPSYSGFLSFETLLFRGDFTKVTLQDDIARRVRHVAFENLSWMDFARPNPFACLRSVSFQIRSESVLQNFLEFFCKNVPTLRSLDIALQDELSGMSSSERITAVVPQITELRLGFTENKQGFGFHHALSVIFPNLEKLCIDGLRFVGTWRDTGFQRLREFSGSAHNPFRSGNPNNMLQYFGPCIEKLHLKPLEGGHTGMLQHLYHFQNLTDLDVRYFRLDRDFLGSLAKMNRLKRLNVSKTDVTDDCFLLITSAPALVDLRANDCVMLTGDVFGSFCPDSKLVRLHMAPKRQESQGPVFTAEQLDVAAAAMPLLRELAVSAAGISDKPCRFAQRFRSLQLLRACRVKDEDTLVENLSGMVPVDGRCSVEILSYSA
jgi:hypothetical protein